MTLKRATCFCLLGLLTASCASTRLYGEPARLEDALGDLDESVLTNLGSFTLPALTDLDEAQLEAMCRDFQNQLHGGYVVELAPLREVAGELLPLLEEHPQTRPYAAWLRARLDYLAVADQLRINVPAPRLEPGQQAPVPPLPGMNPTPDVERSVWQEYLKTEPASSRARAYVSQLKPIFKAEGVPGELVWLAEVESSFDPQARSPIGALGLYQLMPETARSLGLTLWPWDQRLNPEKNARAAAHYLKYLYDKFGDWRLTMAAYNAGEGLVRRLLEKHGGRSYDDIAEHLPAETQLYVPKVEATILRREGAVLEALKMPKAG